VPFLTVVSDGIDGVFTTADPWPFIGLHYLQVRWQMHGRQMCCDPAATGSHHVCHTGCVVYCLAHCWCMKP
jgi:hypothetical protein